MAACGFAQERHQTKPRVTRHELSVDGDDSYIATLVSGVLAVSSTDCAGGVLAGIGNAAVPFAWLAAADRGDSAAAGVGAVPDLPGPGNQPVVPGPPSDGGVGVGRVG